MNLLFLGAVANNPSPTATPHLSFRKPLKLGEVRVRGEATLGGEGGCSDLGRCSIWTRTPGLCQGSPSERLLGGSRALTLPVSGSFSARTEQKALRPRYCPATEHRVPKAPI